MADDILKNIPLPADLPENWTSDQIVAPTGAEVGMDTQHGYNYLMRQVNNAQKAATALNEGKLGLHDTADDSNKLGGYELRLSDHPNSINVLVQTVDEDGSTHIDTRRDSSVGLTAFVASDPHYVRFNDGTQICWELGSYVEGLATETHRRVAFPVPFTVSPAILATANVNIGPDAIISVGWESATGFSIGANSSEARGITSWIAIGRWK